MNSIEQEKILEIMRLCNQKIEEQKTHESNIGYGIDDYSEGRIVGGASLARRILAILQSIPI